MADCSFGLGCVGIRGAVNHIRLETLLFVDVTLYRDKFADLTADRWLHVRNTERSR